MTNPITLNEAQNRFLQSIFREMYENDQIRSLEGPLILSIVNKLETWPLDLSLTEQENRRMQVQLESFYEIAKLSPRPCYPTTLNLNSTQANLIIQIQSKLEAT